MRVGAGPAALAGLLLPPDAAARQHLVQEAEDARWAEAGEEDEARARGGGVDVALLRRQVGGLGTEIEAIVRRAFLSRRLPPGALDDLGLQHVRPAPCAPPASLIASLLPSRLA